MRRSVSLHDRKVLHVWSLGCHVQDPREVWPLYNLSCAKGLTRLQKLLL